MNKNALFQLDTNPQAFVSLFYNGLGPDDENFFEKINALAKSINNQIDVTLKEEELNRKEATINGSIDYNYGVQAALYLLHEKFAQYNLMLTVLYDKRTPDYWLHLFVQKENEYTSVNAKDYILCTMQEADKPLLEEIFIYGLACSLETSQRGIFAGRYRLGYDEVSVKLQHNELSAAEFTCQLTDITTQCICTGTWFQVIENKLNSVCLRIVSPHGISIKGKSTYATLWLNDTDIKLITTWLPKAITIAQGKGTPMLIITLSVNTGQKRTDSEWITLPLEQLLELSTCLKEQQQWVPIKNEIYTAFKDVKLQDGIGYYEAIAIDDFYKKDSPEYIAAKAKDERDDWTKMLALFEYKDTDCAAPCFMDAKGLHFYLPFLMVRQDPYVTDIMAVELMALKHPPENNVNLYLYPLLTPGQKRCILHYYQYMMAIDKPWWREGDLQENPAWVAIQKQNNTTYNFMELMKERFDV